MFAYRIFRLLTAVLAGLAVLLPVSACGLVNSGPSAKDTASAFLDSLASGNDAAAAARTDNPDAARKVLEATRRQLKPKAVTVSPPDVPEPKGDAPTRASFDVSWDFGSGRVWKYRGVMDLIEGSQGWQVRWAPSVLHPKLAAEQALDFSEQRPTPAPVLDRDGAQLMGAEQLVQVSVGQAKDAAAVAGPLAGALAAVDPGITQQSIVDGAAKTPPGQPYSVVTLRQADYDRVKPQIYNLPGLRFAAQTKALAAGGRGYGSQVLPSIAKQADEMAKAKAGWKVVTRNAAGQDVETLFDKPAQPADAVTATLSDRVQKAAEAAVDPVPQGAMLVALQPSSGDVLAVAQNAAADAQGPGALKGQYPPGSTFKVITANAALSTGKVGIDTPVQCPGKKDFSGHVFPNDHEFDLGTVPLRTAFAKSCNTTFAQLGSDLPPDALTNSAKQLGVGVDFDMPGAATITGKVPSSNDPVQRASEAFGQGPVLASPFGMAMATASVARGSMPTPSLIKGSPAKADAAPQPISQQTLDQLRPMMREVVLSGTATQLRGSGEVAGKTGTAQFGDGTHAHGWFVGYRGDVAFAVLITDAGASAPAVEVARSFLANTQ